MYRRARSLLPSLFLALFVSHPQASLEQARQAIVAGEYREALGLLEQVSKDERHNPRHRLLEGLALAGNERHDAAQEILVTLIAEWPEQPEPYNNLAALYASQGRMEEARVLLEQAMRTHAAYATIYNNLISITVEMSRSSYASALRMQGQESGMQLATLHELSLPTTQEPVQVVLADASRLAMAEAAPQLPVDLPPTVSAPQELLNTPPEQAKAAHEPPAEPLQVATVDQPDNPQPDNGEVIAEIGPDEEIEQVLLQWAQAWSNQDVDAYLAAYSQNFVPASEQSLAQWREQRRQRLTRPSRIDVDLQAIEVLVFDARRARARIVQAYNADHYSDLSRKELQMVHEDGRWRIAAERTIETLQP